MPMQVNEQALARFNSFFGTISDDARLSDSTIAVLDGETRLKVGKGDFKGNLFRSAAKVNRNNAVRDTFKQMVINIFGSEDDIPASVKTAMKWDTDFDQKGRPLTKRRIRDTMRQIQDVADKNIYNNNLNKLAPVIESIDVLKSAKGVTEDDYATFSTFVNDLADQLEPEVERILSPEIRAGKTPSEESIREFFIKAGEVAEELKDKHLSGVKSDVESSGKFGMALVRSFDLLVSRNAELRELLFTNDRRGGEFEKSVDRVGDQMSFELDNPGEDGDGVKDTDRKPPTDTAVSMCARIARHLPDIRGFYVLAMPRKEALAELMRISSAEYQRSIHDGRSIRVSDAVKALKELGTPEAKDLLSDYYKEIGQQLIDNTLRPKDTVHTDYLYMAIDDHLKEQLVACARNRAMNMIKGTTDNQPDTIMGSPQADAELAKAYHGKFNPGYSEMRTENVFGLNLEKRMSLVPDALKTAAKENEALAGFVMNVMAPPYKNTPRLIFEGTRPVAADIMAALGGNVHDQLKAIPKDVYNALDPEMKRSCVELAVKMFFHNNPNLAGKVDFCKGNLEAAYALGRIGFIAQDVASDVVSDILVKPENEESRANERKWAKSIKDHGIELDFSALLMTAMKSAREKAGVDEDAFRELAYRGLVDGVMGKLQEAPEMPPEELKELVDGSLALAKSMTAELIEKLKTEVIPHPEIYDVVRAQSLEGKLESVDTMGIKHEDLAKSFRPEDVKTVAALLETFDSVALTDQHCKFQMIYVKGGLINRLHKALDETKDVRRPGDSVEQTIVTLWPSLGLAGEVPEVGDGDLKSKFCNALRNSVVDDQLKLLKSGSDMEQADIDDFKKLMSYTANEKDAARELENKFGAGFIKQFEQLLRASCVVTGLPHDRRIAVLEDPARLNADEKSVFFVKPGLDEGKIANLEKKDYVVYKDRATGETKSMPADGYVRRVKRQEHQNDEMLELMTVSSETVDELKLCAGRYEDVTFSLNVGGAETNLDFNADDQHSFVNPLSAAGFNDKQIYQVARLVNNGVKDMLEATGMDSRIPGKVAITRDEQGNMKVRVRMHPRRITGMCRKQENERVSYEYKFVESSHDLIAEVTVDPNGKGVIDSMGLVPNSERKEKDPVASS